MIKAVLEFPKSLYNLRTQICGKITVITALVKLELVFCN